MKIISPTQAFKSGADLWILSDFEYSLWHYKIDWHTGFLIQKIKSQKIKSISSSARTFLEQTYKELKEQLKNLPSYKEEKQKVPNISNWNYITKSIWSNVPQNLPKPDLTYSLKNKQDSHLHGNDDRHGNDEKNKKDFPRIPTPILVESSFYFPNLWTVELPYTPDWLNVAYQVWHSLNRPTLRIFTPQPIRAEDVERKWSSHAKNIIIQCVLDK